MSRIKIQATEWMLHKSLVQKIFHLWGFQLIDLFASIRNKHSDILFLDSASRSSSSGYSVNLLGEHVCLCLSSHLSDSKSPETYGAVSLPSDSDSSKMATQDWYTDLLQLSVACPRKLPLWQNLLQQPNSTINHPNPEVFSLHAWLLSTEVSKKKDFLASLENSYQLLGDRAHKKITMGKLTSSVAGVMNDKLIPILPL